MPYKVLIVDDEEIVCRGLAQFVKWENHGFTVAGTAYNGKDALSIIKGTDIQVVFTDVRMPQETGLDLLNAIRKDHPHIKVVMLSGFCEFSYVQQALRLGAVDYLTKPANLGEVGNLLDRLRNMLESERREGEVRSWRIQAILLSLAKGYSHDSHAREEAEAALPPLGAFYGARLGLLRKDGLEEAQLEEKKQGIRQAVQTLVPGCYILNNDVYELFLILPYQSEDQVQAFLDLLSSMDPQLKDWAAGISKAKEGMKCLSESYQESGRALRYQRAKNKGGGIYYRNIQTLFSQNSPQLQDAIQELTARLANPESRMEAWKVLKEGLDQLKEEGVTLMQMQTACIQCLIEINSLLQGLSLPSGKLHQQLDQTLGRLLLCMNFPETESCMMDYLAQAAASLNGVDDASLGKGVIRDIQLFIRQHYDENLSLNMLAAQFYLHPNYLSRLFKEKAGKNFSDYVTQVRMEKVMKLLEDPENKISDISLMVGYDNPRYFSKVFKQYAGCTPSEYREGLAHSSGA